MKITGLDHVQLAMPPGQEEQARRFYSGLLGLQEIPKPEQLVSRGGVWFAGGSVYLHLGVEKEFTPARKAHPCFIVTDLDAACRELEAAGVEVIRDQTIPGVDRFHAFDPFGNRLEFIQDGQAFSQQG
ncbi:MAG: glyoxalase [Chloroflexi bacterium]|jgi:catechol 2,3-dioxygenase-like lactoylglutathione lyase family enzyme|nr:glyoxalase [Chloroflexota bacterium]